MKRYKELKCDSKIFTEQYIIDEKLLENGFQWFLDCEVEDVRIEISRKDVKPVLIFNSGIFFSGTWKYGCFRDGVWKYGTWEDGVWFNGVWYNGTFKKGIIENGKFHHGTIEDGIIRGGEFYNMIINKNVKKEEPKKVTQPQNDESVPQGEKIIEKMKTLNEKTTKRSIMSFNQFKKVNEMDGYEDEFTKHEEIVDDSDSEFENPSDELDHEISSDELDSIEHELEETPEEERAEHEIGGSQEDEPFLHLGTEKPERITTPEDRLKDWTRLSSNPSGRKIFRSFDEYLRSQGQDPTKYREIKEAEPKVKGVRRKA